MKYNAQTVYRLHKKGISFRKIAKQFNKSVSTIFEHWERQKKLSTGGLATERTIVYNDFAGRKDGNAEKVEKD